MATHESPHFFERYDVLSATQAELERYGYFLQPVLKEHTEGLITEPLLQRVRTIIKKRGFSKVAGRVAITFSGYGEDPRDIYDIPEIRAYWHTLDRALPELPALLSALPALGYNGPGNHLLLLGTVDRVIHEPAMGRFQAHVVEGPRLIADAMRRIRAAGRAYHLSETAVANLVEHFRRNAGAE